MTLESTASSRVAISPKFDNGEIFLRALGDIPLSRIVFDPWPGTGEEEDVIQAKDRLLELVDGTLVEKACSAYDSTLASVLTAQIMNFALPRKLGVLGGAGYMVRMHSGNVRLPDASFTRFDRFPSHRLPRTPITAIVPDLAIEIVNSRNTRLEMIRKVQEYFDSGVRLVWIIDPTGETVDVYTSATSARTVRGAGDSLFGGEVLPGFTISLREIFHTFDYQS